MNNKANTMHELKALKDAANQVYLALYAAILHSPTTPEFNRLRELNDNLRVALVRAQNEIQSCEQLKAYENKNQ